MHINLIPNINKEGYMFIIISFFLSCAGFSISCGLGMVFLFITLLCIYFFRDPVRVVPQNNKYVVSPGDGTILKIKQVISPIDKSTVTCISIFLNALNVHVNRIPVSGTIQSKEYKAGRFISATFDKSSEENERQRLVIKSTVNDYIVIVEQIAGLIARRIVCNVQENQEVLLGERFGIIKFGSRVNLYLPSDIMTLVTEGQTVTGGETIIADLTKELSTYDTTFKYI
ncbi:phosphatidylserine decarboxylase [Neoehrlichia mikurensis]|uniref:Phosphatidylserine decarboxylase proenzyme n=1 Tax=Neoehrlichia mikurensis TaxID=89586 RepID=A0A9Q9BUD7_9RICK|nr:phosphatidylserine decarboxylase [Neoehrlichia mikurensis]QXK92063.1 phosphatidylserine decarboxylase [Neoehrlichia mikurensis]QXK92520.1 phosphatidylserine decarboxylase [Neoehrlichia mikurensis]QXK93756.1 phosphatidylserine decarboxylase [Neoehrlichia mikurensis]UTO55268.1 phosphatidylserine decarboxylase [Neoehrlichia mikurensis]UTO56189.1 phosphatidylserine decarboxylase [Neoehrlichia mikurensis]